jgi:hypothetical protein
MWMLSFLLLNVALCHCMIGARRFEALWCLKCLRRRAFLLGILILGDETTALPRNGGDTSKKNGGSVCEFFFTLIDPVSS